ncbi:hypothetical protein FF011L_43920 [Roseimaritima multifibrata]|uniref:Uncharacterized protein n=1 Tax=Roseimaritima multifibrata TaxID=1930274 RepID=A0A517ML40_9BACT|nr:AsmA-like C-terminal region-containing protein [Roseimaritima multifibrata]QDS95594.1 hypothetical protein FF011L_43920 [Roseimaritima multifibrata]
MEAEPTTNQEKRAERSPLRKRRGGRWFVGVVALLLLIVWVMLPETLGEQSRRSLEAKLAEHYQGLDVRIGSGRFVPSEGVVFEDLVISVPQVDGQLVPLLKVARIVAEADIAWDKIRAGELPVAPQRMLVSGVELNLWAEGGKRVSVERLFPFPQFGPGCPLVLVRDGRVRLVKDLQQLNSGLEWQNIDARITKAVAAESGNERFQIRASATSSVCDGMTIALDGDATGWTISGTASNFRLDHRQLQRLPARFAKLTTPVNGIDCTGDLAFRANGGSGQALTWGVQAEVKQGRFEHPTLPLSVRELQGKLVVKDSGAVIEQLQGRFNGALCRLEGTVDRIGWPCDLHFDLTANDLMLDQRLANVLPAEMRQRWERLQPSGRIDMTAQLTCHEGIWSNKGSLNSKGVSVRFDRFPYPVHDLNGTVQFDNGLLASRELFGTVDGQPMRCELRLAPPGSGHPQWFRAKVDGTIAIDESLLNALTPRNQLRSDLETFIRSLSPVGGIQVARAEIAIDAAGNKTQAFDLRVDDAQLRYAGFPYPLYGVDGQILVKDGDTRLVNFVAKNGDAAAIRCNGRYSKSDEGGDLQLDFVGEEVPLDRTLRTALSPEMRHTWDALAPTGVVEQLNVSVINHPAMTEPALRVWASLDSQAGVSHNTVSLRPVSLPYRLDIVGGEVTYEDHKVRIEQLDGRHDGSRLTANGTCIETTDGRWQLALNVLSGSRLTVDPELISSLPTEVQGAFQKLQLRGPVGISGSTKLLLPDETHLTPESEFDLSLQLEGNHIGDVGPVRDIRGEMTLAGLQNESGVRADGVLQIDSLHFQEIQLTGIHGPISIRGDQLYLGARNAALEPESDFQPVAGKIFGGQFTLAGRMGLATSQYDLFVSVADADVPGMLSDFQEAPTDMTGKLSGEVRVEGALGAMHLLKGNGEARLEGANLYQIPQIVQLLTQLRVTPDEDVAFTNGTAQFSISGDQLAFSQLRLWGDLVALHGTGTVSRLKDLDLTFNTRVSPQTGWGRLVRPLGNQRYTLWTIYVKGPIDSPSIERRALDGVSETLERLFPVMGRDEGDDSARLPFPRLR